jgi:hypothetical protein
VVVEQFAVDVAAVLPTTVRVHEQAGRGWLGPKSALQGRSNQFLRHGSYDVPAHYLLADYILIRTQISPGAVGQR